MSTVAPGASANGPGAITATEPGPSDSRETSSRTVATSSSGATRRAHGATPLLRTARGVVRPGSCAASTSAATAMISAGVR